MNIRQARTSDIPQLIRLLYQVQEVHASKRSDLFVRGEKKYTQEQLGVILAQEHTPVFVAEEDGMVIGYAFCILEEQTGNNLVALRRLYIDDLCVDEAARGKGVGTQLYGFVKEEAKRRGCYHITLNVWQLNTTAMEFYRKQGMSVLKQTMEEILE